MDAWNVGGLDLEAYLERIGVAAQPPSRSVLDQVHEAHVRAFTFDNVDVLLGQHRGVELEPVQDKFVGRGRGGYCFEHATLLAAALARLGFDVTRRLGRVGDPATAARTHAVIQVALDDEVYLADPGFGLSVLRPIRLVDGATDDYGGWAYQVTEVADGHGRAWRLSRWRDEQWQVMHTHDELPVRPVDIVMGHHFTSTFPSSHFRHGLMLTSHGDGRHTSLTESTLTVRRPRQPTEHTRIDAGGMADALSALGVRVSEEETARLTARFARPSDDG